MTRRRKPAAHNFDRRPSGGLAVIGPGAGITTEELGMWRLDGRVWKATRDAP